MIVYTCNPSYLGGGDKKIMVGGQLRLQVSKTLSQKQAGCGGAYLFLQILRMHR
jgi:hypothetical protein